MSTSIADLAEILQKLLIEDANQIGRESGFIQRQRKLSGASFAQTLVFGWQANPHASLEDLCQSACVSGVTISAQGLQERMNSPQANEFLLQLLQQGLSYLVEAQGLEVMLLRRFQGVYLQDSSKIELPAFFSDVWRGNKDGQACLKIQTLFDYQKGQLGLRLAQGRQHDSPLQMVDLPRGSLRLADLGYFKVEVFKQLNERGVYWLTRLPARVGIWTGEKVENILTWLNQQASAEVDQIVELSAQRLKCRLIAVRVPARVAAERQERVREAAKSRKKSQLQEKTLALCDWTILITNLSAEDLSVEEALVLLRVRWQIELLFKLWKHDLSLDEWRSEQPHQILTEIYAKLLLALIQHWLLLLSAWEQADRSLVKAAHSLSKHAFQLLSVLGNLSRLVQALHFILPTLKRCTTQKRKTRPATFQLLSRASP